MSSPVGLASGLHGAIGCDFRRAQNELLFVEWGGMLSRLNLGRTTVLSSGTGTLKGTWLWDFDTGQLLSDASGADVWWEQQTEVVRAMAAYNNALLVNLGVVDFDAITRDTLANLSYSSAPIVGNDDASNQLVNGDVFAVLTTAGNYAKARVVTYGYDLQIEWVTYQLATSYEVLGTGYSQPEDVKASSDGIHAYVSERTGNLVKVKLGDASRTAARLIASGMTAPQQIFLDESNDAAYVVEYAPSGKLWRVDLASGAKTTVLSNLENAVGMILSADRQYAYISEQTKGADGGRVSRFQLSDGTRHPIVTGLTAPFFLEWPSPKHPWLLVPERDPANRISAVNVATNTSIVAADGLSARPSSVAATGAGQILVCSNAAIERVDLSPSVFEPTGPDLNVNRLIPRTECTMPVSPTAEIGPATLLQSPDPSDGKQLYLPDFGLAEQDVDGKRKVRVRLGPVDDGWRLEVAVARRPRTGGTDPLPIDVTPVLAYTTAGGVQRELTLETTDESESVFGVTLSLPTFGDRDEVFYAMTTFEWNCRLLLRCRFDAAVPVPGTGGPARDLYRQASQQIDVPLNFANGSFVFNPTLYPDVFRGIDDVGEQNFDVVVRSVKWKGRAHQYYQEERTPHLFHYLPDALYLMRTPQRPYVPNMRVRFESSDGSLQEMRALVEFAVTPVVDEQRLADAAKQLAVHLPKQLPTGVTGPVLEALVVTDPDKLRLEITIPRAGGSGSTPQERPGVVKNLSDPFSDQISGLTVANFQEIFDAMFGTSAVVFSGSLHIDAQGDESATSLPFIARLKDLHGPVLAVEETHNGDGTLQVAVTNASESPLTVRSLPIEVIAKDPERTVPAHLANLTIGDTAAAFPIELAAGQALKAHVIADSQPGDAPVTPTAPAECRYDLHDVDEHPDPDAVWNAIFDATVPAEYTREITVAAVEESFKPNTDVSAIAIDFENGDEVMLRPGQLEGKATVRVPLKDLIVRKQQDSTYRYTQVTIRGSQQTRAQKTDNLDILIPDVTP